MRIVMHAGMGKTGTSSLQSTFAKNRHTLASAQIIYPKMGPSPSHGLLSAIAKPYEARPRSFDRYSQADWLAAADCAKGAIVDSAAKRPKVLLLSTEYAFAFPARGQRALRELLREFSQDISIVVWLRDPIDYYRSSIHQLAKPIGDPSRDRRPPDPRTYSPRLREKVARLRAIWDTVDLNLYNRASMPNGSIVSEFIQSALPEARNLSLHEIQANDAPAPPIPDEHRELLRQSCQDDYAFLVEAGLIPSAHP